MAIRHLVLALAGASLAAVAHAADVKVLASGATKALVDAAAAAFEQRTGDRLVVVGGTAGAVMRQVQAGEAFDVVIVTQDGVDELGRQGKVDARSAQPLARVGIGAAVRQGAAQPKIASADDFRRTLLSARAVAYIDPAAGGSSGIYLAKLFERMGIADQMRPKSVLVNGGLVADKLVDGQADLALQQMSELTGVPGVVVLGTIPAEYQHFTTYVAAVGAASADPAAARALIAQLQDAPARRFAAAHGMQAP
jgi:molybdate transport system substrate-binding protein